MELAEVKLVALLREKNLHIATAESCTGGLVSAAITAVPGSSEVFDGGIVSYANAVKAGLLGVSEQTLSTVGAVSAPCAEQMAEGVRRVMNADIGISLTGIAGPGGGTTDKPVGTVFLGVASANGVRAHRLSLSGDRDTVRALSVREALQAAIKEASALSENLV